MTVSQFSMVLGLFGGGFIFGWITSNFIYGRTECKDCFIALIRGFGCDTCKYSISAKKKEETI